MHSERGPRNNCRPGGLRELAAAVCVAPWRTGNQRQQQKGSEGDRELQARRPPCRPPARHGVGVCGAAAVSNGWKLLIGRGMAGGWPWTEAQRLLASSGTRLHSVKLSIPKSPAARSCTQNRVVHCCSTLLYTPRRQRHPAQQAARRQQHASRSGAAMSTSSAVQVVREAARLNKGSRGLQPVQQNTCVRVHTPRNTFLVNSSPSLLYCLQYESAAQKATSGERAFAARMQKQPAQQQLCQAAAAGRMQKRDALGTRNNAAARPRHTDEAGPQRHAPINSLPRTRAKIWGLSGRPQESHVARMQGWLRSMHHQPACATHHHALHCCIPAF